MQGFKVLGLAACATALLLVDAEGREFDGSNPFVCAPLQIASCGSGSECSSETADSINLPRFLRVNAGESAITGQRPGGELLSTSIMSRQSDDGRLVLQGTERGLSWTISIDEDAGDMTIVAAGSNVAFVAFGSCIRP